MAFKPSDRRKAPDEIVEPNITPIMNLMVVLIPMLLSVAQFVQLSLLEYLPPPMDEMVEEEAAGDGNGGGEVATLDLLLNVGDEGFEISIFGDTKGENFIKLPILPDKTYDFDALHDELVRIKTEVVGTPIRTEENTDPLTKKITRMEIFKFPDASRVKISAKGDLEWQVLVSLLDATRNYKSDEGIKKPLFPQPLMGQIQ